MCLSRTASEQRLAGQMERQRLEKAYVESVVAAAQAPAMDRYSEEINKALKAKRRDDLSDVLTLEGEEVRFAVRECQRCVGGGPCAAPRRRTNADACVSHVTALSRRRRAPT